MKFFRVITGLIMLVTIFLFNSPVVNANYRFDDVYGSSGSGAQWVVITGSRGTIGGATKNVSMDIKGDLVEGRDPLAIDSGQNDDVSNKDIYNILLVLPTTTTELTMNYASTHTGEPTTPDPWITPGDYTAIKGSQGSPYGSKYDDNWKQYKFTIMKNVRQGTFESIGQYLVFGQNPSVTSSQTLPIPFVIANVYNGTAADNSAPLVFRTILRDATPTGNGNIVAYNKFDWNVVSEKNIGERQWVFLALDSETDMYDSNPKYYYLTSEITNHCAARYAVQRYDTYSSVNQEPMYWKFDLPKDSYSDYNLAENFSFAELSHILPGLTSVYTKSFNMKDKNKRVIPLYCVDPYSTPQDLYLNHNVVYGVNLGEATGEKTGKADPYKITAFRLMSNNNNFLGNLQTNVTKSSYTPVIPDTRISNSSVTVEAVGSGTTVLQSVRLTQQIPGNSRHSKSVDGMLPIHVTFNIPKTSLNQHWDEFATEWYKNGNIDTSFKKYYSLNLLSYAKSDYNNLHLDLTEALDNLSYYNDQIKIFLDESREVLTISFILLVLDGTSDSVKPSVAIAPDEVDGISSEYIVARDGYEDGKWDLGIYVANANYVGNLYSPDVSPSATASGSGGGGGGCNSGFWALGFVLILIFALSYKKLRYEI